MKQGTNVLESVQINIKQIEEALRVNQAPNLTVPIHNPSFEEGTLHGWASAGNGTVSVDNLVMNTGLYSARMDVSGGGTLDLFSTELIPIVPRRSILTSGYFRSDSGITKAYLLIKYFTADGNQLPSPATDNVAYEATFNLDKYLENIAGSSFVRKLRETAAPAGCAFYQVGVRAIAGAGGGKMWVDDISLPTYLESEAQFRWQIVDFTSHVGYLKPGASITLHQSADGEVGEVMYFNACVSNENALFIIHYDNEIVYLPVSFLLESPPNVAAAFCEEIDVSSADPLRHRYYAAVAPATLIKYNYRQSVVLSNPSVVLRKIVQEVLGVGTGLNPVFVGNLANFPIYPGTLSITDGVEVFSDNGAGVLTGDMGGAGFYNPLTGAYMITFANAPGAGTNIYAAYNYLLVNTALLYFDGGSIYKKIKL